MTIREQPGKGQLTDSKEAGRCEHSSHIVLQAGVLCEAACDTEQRSNVFLTVYTDDVYAELVQSDKTAG